MCDKLKTEELFSMDAVDVYKLVLQGSRIKRFPKGFWGNPEAIPNAIKCIRFLFDEMLQYNDEDLKSNSLGNIMIKNKLQGMLGICFDHSVYRAIDTAYPGKFKPWELKTVPLGYWDDRSNGIKATRWLIEEKLKFTDEDIKEQLKLSLFKENGLFGMITSCFGCSPYKAINALYPGRFKPWELKFVPVGLWDERSTCVEATRWLIEEKLKLTDEEIVNKVNLNFFTENGLGGLIHSRYDSIFYRAIEDAYPGKFKPWNFKCSPMGIWKDVSNGIEATRWLIEEKLRLTDEEIKEQLTQSLFMDNGLGGMLGICFNNSPYEAIESAYPNKFKPWDFSTVYRKCWEDKKNRISAIKWLIEDMFQYTEEEVKANITAKSFMDNRLSGLLTGYYNSSPYLALEEAYPGKFKPWEFSIVPTGLWCNIDNGIEAVKWLIEDKLQLDDDELRNQLNYQLFADNGLGGMLQACFKSNPCYALEVVYPGKFDLNELKSS